MIYSRIFLPSWLAVSKAALAFAVPTLLLSWQLPRVVVAAVAVVGDDVGVAAVDAAAEIEKLPVLDPLPATLRRLLEIALWPC